MLKLESVTKSYDHRKSQVMAMDSISLEIEEGDFVSIVGPSGSGKSTVLLILGGMLSPSSGRVLIGDESVYDLSTEDRARLRGERVGFVFQTFNLVPFLTALENVQVPLLLSGTDEGIQIEKATALLERVGLGDRVDHKPNELSVGQQQRVALARMLANDPKIILADEPTGNLDPETCKEVIDFLVELNAEGRTIVMVTHDPQMASRAKEAYALWLEQLLQRRKRLLMLREFMAITKALSDENRVRTLMYLREDELCVCQIIEMLGLAPSTVSKHLSILKQAGLIESSKKGRWVYYNLANNDASPVVLDALEWVRDSLEKDKLVSQDDRRLKEVRKACLEDLCRAYINGDRKAA